MHYIYILKEDDQIIYVGHTNNPQIRLYQHTKSIPNYKNGNGMFYNRFVTMEIVLECEDRRSAFKEEKRLKDLYGFEYTEGHNAKIREYADQIRNDFANLNGSRMQFYKDQANIYKVGVRTIRNIVNSVNY